MKVIATGIVSQEGKLSLTAEKKFKNDLKAFAGKPVVLTLEKKSRKRSTRQNAYYWGVIIDISVQAFRNTGHAITPEQVHEIFKYKFLKTVIPNLETGEPLEYIKSTSELSTSDFMDYVAEIQQYMAETFDCYLPDPLEFIEA